MSPQPGKLYLCASPIGNLDDISLRVLQTLAEVDLIYCEDTRHSRKLLSHFGIQKPLKAFHEHNEQEAVRELREDLKRGLAVALLSDAGMPGISDPGRAAVRLAQKEQLPYTVLPGASAGLTALVLSGLDSDRFIFEGFLPRKGKARIQRLESLDHQTATAILYESPQRVLASLAEFAQRWPQREAALCREISKVYENCQRALLPELLAHYEKFPPKGEIVLLLAGISEEESAMSFEEALHWARERVAEGSGVNQAAKEAAQLSGCKKRALYDALLGKDAQI